MGGHISYGYNEPVCSGEITTAKDYLTRMFIACTGTFWGKDLSVNSLIAAENTHSDYCQRRHRDSSEAAERELNRLQALSAKEWLDLARSQLGYIDSTWARDPDDKITRRRLAEMWLKVRKWQPPAGQENVKEFALDELRKELDFRQPSGRGIYREYQNTLTYRQDALTAAQREYNYCLREYQEDIKRDRVRRQRIRDFITSLEGLTE